MQIAAYSFGAVMHFEIILLIHARSVGIRVSVSGVRSPGATGLQVRQIKLLREHCIRPGVLAPIGPKNLFGNALPEGPITSPRTRRSDA